MSSDATTKTIPLYITSDDRNPELSTSSSDFVITLNKTLRNVRRVDICSVEMPRTWYNINKHNNTLVLIGYMQDSYPIIKLTIGQYTLESLCSELERQLSLQLGTVRVGFIPISHKIIIALPFSDLDFYMLMSGSLYEILGFTDSIIRVYGYSVTSDGVCDISPTRNVFIKSNVLSTNINTSYVSSFKKAWTVDDSNSRFSIYIDLGHSTNQIAFPVNGEFDIYQIMYILMAKLNSGTGLGGSNTWLLSLDTLTKTVTIRNNNIYGGFSIGTNSPLFSTIFNFDLSTSSISKSHTGRPIDFSMHQNVIRKVLVSNAQFAIEKIYDARVFNIETDLGTRFSIDNIDLQLVDSQNRPIDLNGKPWSCTLLVSCNI
jgi:hypothetical protein